MTSDDGLVGTGPLGGAPDDTPSQPDASPSADARPGPDARPGAPDASRSDAAGGPTCGASVADVGAPTAFATGTATLFSTKRIFVARDAAGLYAMSASCTHQGTTLQVRSSLLHCSSHGANFNLDGGIVSGPISRPLQHYAMCVLASGHVAVDTARPVDAATRLVV